MTKRKRASLKDKNAESLGLTPKKGKGIDVLFGGPLDQDDEPEGDIDLDTEQEDETLSGAPAVFTAADGRAVDELGLPVALEAPPDDLILASTPIGSPAVGEEDAVNPATSPFAMPDLEESTASGFGEDANDFTGILDADNSSRVEEENLSNSEKENDLSGIVGGSSSSGSRADEADLSGLMMAEDDLSGLVAEAPAAPTPPAPEAPAGDELAGLTAASLEDTPPPDTINDLSGLVTADEDLSGLTSDLGSSPSDLPPAAPPPTTAAPINVPPPAPQTPPAPSTGTESFDSTPYTPPPGVPPPRPTTSAPPGPSSARTKIDAFTGIVTEGGPVSTRDILPEDALTEAGDHILAVEKRERLDRDDSTAEKIARYIGPERRQKLDDEIMDLYGVVANELSDSKDDAAFALKTLREAQDIIIEDISQYDEALYRVAVVRTMLVRKKNLQRWSYSWGMFVFGYAVVWLVAFVVGFEFIDPQINESVSAGAAAIRSAWLSALAGGVGGCIAILYSLSWRVAIKHEFDRQYIMKYLVQPVMGFVLGAVIFFITSAGFLLVSPEVGNASEAFLGGPQMVAFQILFGFIAGFRQRLVYYMVDRLVQRITPEATESKEPTSVVPTDDYQRLSPYGD